MPKKGENSKAVEARSRKEDGKRAATEKATAAAEDREWAAAGEGSKTKAQAKKQEQVSSSSSCICQAYCRDGPCGFLHQPADHLTAH